VNCFREARLLRQGWHLSQELLLQTCQHHCQCVMDFIQSPNKINLEPFSCKFYLHHIRLFVFMVTSAFCPIMEKKLFG
jgi:hypothetical protein